MLDFGYRNSERSLPGLKPKKERLMWQRLKRSSDLEFQTKTRDGLTYIEPKRRAA